MNRLSYPNFLLLLIGFLFLVGLVGTSFATEIPIAQSVQVDTLSPVGTIITYSETEAKFKVVTEARFSSVYGVVALRPAIVFGNATNTVPVVTNGVTELRVSAENGQITRGDLLVTATTSGLAMKALVTDREVFGIALESGPATGEAVIMADINKARAEAIQSELEQAERGVVSTAVTALRAIIATVLAIGALLFSLYSFRKIWTTSITSIGRNPRARTSVWLLAVAGIIVVLILLGVVIFVSIGVLVLPV